MGTMRLSTKSRYGTRAIIEIARYYRKPPIKRKEITAKQLIPDSYLENILVTLKAAGLITTIRGANGGYQLAKAPDEITVFEVVQALEGCITPVPCIDSGECNLFGICITRSIWSEMYQAMEQVLTSYTLKDVLEKEQERDTFSYVI